MEGGSSNSEQDMNRKGLVGGELFGKIYRKRKARDINSDVNSDKRRQTDTHTHPGTLEMSMYSGPD